MENPMSKTLGSQVDKLVGECKDDPRLWGSAAEWKPPQAQIRALIRAGLSTRTIAEQLNMPSTTVRSTRSALTVELRRLNAG
jgi:DNA-binding NarL/FixJ family response regulator